MTATSRSAARWLAVLGWALAVATSAGLIAWMDNSAAVFSGRYAHAGIAGPYSALVLWGGIPLALATVTSVAVLTRAPALIALIPMGTLAAFALVALFSVGPFFLPAATALLTAVLLQVSERRDKWGHATAWLGLILGATALFPLLALLARLHRTS